MIKIYNFFRKNIALYKYEIKKEKKIKYKTKKLIKNQTKIG
jgi:hypothetical protein